MKDNKKKPKNRKQKDKKKRNFESTKTVILLILLAITIAMSFYTMYVINKEKEEKEIPYTEVITSINEDKIEKIKMTSGSATIGVVFKGEGEEEEREKTVLVPSLQAFMEMVQEKVDKEGKKIELIQEPVNPLLKISDTLFSLLPTILLVVLMVMMIKMQGLGGDSGKVYGGEDGSKSPDVRFEDIAGDDHVDAQIRQAFFAVVIHNTALFQPRTDEHHGKQGTLQTEEIQNIHSASPLLYYVTMKFQHCKILVVVMKNVPLW